jgi:hypothetical protein
MKDIRRLRPFRGQRNLEAIRKPSERRSIGVTGKWRSGEGLVKAVLEYGGEV